MARTAIPETSLNTRAGITFTVSTAGDVGNGNYFVWGPNKFLAVGNGGGSTYTVTLTPSSESLDGFTAQGRVISLPAGTIKFVGPIPGYYKQGSDGDRIYVDVSNAAVVLRVYDLAMGN